MAINIDKIKGTITGLAVFIPAKIITMEANNKAVFNDDGNTVLFTLMPLNCITINNQ